MAILLKVKWIDKSDEPNPHQCIRHIGGDSKELQWKHTREQAIESIELGSFAYYVEKNARALRLNVAQTPDGKKYLTVQANGDYSQLLLDLPQCPDHVESREKI
jgi:hypothetical protein